MHLLIGIQQQFPEFERPEEVEKFLKHIVAKQYSAKHLHPSWNRIRPREIRLFDFTILEKIEKEVLEDLNLYSCADKLKRVQKLLDTKIVGKIARKVLGLEKVELPEKKKLAGKDQFAIYLTVLGKVKDEYKGRLELI